MLDLQKLSAIVVGSCLEIIVIGVIWAALYASTDNPIISTLITAGGVSVICSILLIINILYGDRSELRNIILATTIFVATGIMTCVLLFMGVI